MQARPAIVISIILLSSFVITAAQEPAVVNSFTEGGCTVGWVGCDPADALPLPDGSWTCPINGVGIVPITGDRFAVQANDVNANVFWHCRSQIYFGQVNPLGVGGTGGEIVAVQPEVICLFFPNACKGRGTVIANTSTVGAVATCGVFGTVTTNLQLEVTPSGNANLTCFLPDPRPGS